MANEGRGGVRYLGAPKIKAPGKGSKFYNPDDRTNPNPYGKSKPTGSKGKVYKTPGYNPFQKYLKAVDDAFAGTTGDPPGGPGGPGYYGPSYGGGGGGGGPSFADLSKPYVNYYKRILGINPNKGLVKKAVDGKYTMQEFQLLVQRQDTNRFMKTAQGQEVVSGFQTLWARIFPSLGHQPGVKALRAYLKQKPTKNYRVPTNPSDIRGMYAFLSQTKEFKRIYGDFAGTKFERTMDFAGYRQYKDEFRNIMRQYTDKFATDDELSYFFNSRISPDEFEQNMQVVLGGQDAYAWKGGQQLEQTQAKQAMYGRKGGMQTLQKIAGALEAQKGYMGAKQAEFNLRQNEQGCIEQPGLYGN